MIMHRGGNATEIFGSNTNITFTSQEDKVQVTREIKAYSPIACTT